MKDYRMAYDADPAYRNKRHGLRWYSVVAFLAVVVLLIINIQAMRDNTRAENRRADAAEAQLVIQEQMAEMMEEQNQREADEVASECGSSVMRTYHQYAHEAGVEYPGGDERFVENYFACYEDVESD